MRSGSFIDSLKELSDYMYKHPNKDFKGWKLIDSYSDSSGVFIELFDLGGDVLISIKGTNVAIKSAAKRNDMLTDITESDLAIYMNKLPVQYKSVEEFYKKHKETYPNILVTGYSLGGSLAQMLGNEYGLETYTFEALGTNKISSPKHIGEIYNFINTLDVFVMPVLGRMLGKILVMPVTDKEEYYPIEPLNPLYHMYPYFGTPSKAEPYKRTKDRIKDFTKEGLLQTKQAINTAANQLKSKKILNRFKK